MRACGGAPSADPGEAARWQQAIDPWLAGQTSVVIQIEPGIGTGSELQQ